MDNLLKGDWQKQPSGFYTRDELATPLGFVKIELFDAKTGRLKDLQRVKNMFVTAGKNSLADGLRGETTNSKGIITYCALGTGTNAPALTNVQLQTELVRKAVSVRSVSGNIATFQTFFTTGEGNGALREAGLFGDLASATANSGTLFCRTNISRTKSSADTLTLTWNIVIA